MVIATTELPVLGVTLPLCGNGHQDSGEQCDINDPTTALNYGYLQSFCSTSPKPDFCKYYDTTSLSVSCDQACKILATGDYCGDGRLTNPQERCDGNLMWIANSQGCTTGQCQTFSGCRPGYIAMCGANPCPAGALSDSITECTPAPNYCTPEVDTNRDCKCGDNTVYGSQTCQSTGVWSSCTVNTGRCDPNNPGIGPTCDGSSQPKICNAQTCIWDDSACCTVPVISPTTYTFNATVGTPVPLSISVTGANLNVSAWGTPY